MMRVLVNALSTTNLSGRHVLLGHLSQLAPRTLESHHYLILHHSGNADLRRELGPNVEWVRCPAVTATWPGRSVWQYLRLARALRGVRADVVLDMSGAILAELPVPQLAYAMNPWALTPGLDRSPGEALKAALQRRGYRQTMRRAAVMVFLSNFMRDAYRRNAGLQERASQVVYAGLDEDTWLAARRWRGSQHRDPDQIVSVSAMGRHKDAGTLIRAFARTRAALARPLRLLLVGDWPDPRYQQEIRSLVGELGLAEVVTFAGHVPREELLRWYATARLFALTSRCESFGIPAVEAQAFGTPVVSAACGGVPEVCGEGGLYPEPGDVQATATDLGRLLSDEALWIRTSEAARRNAERFRWDACSPALLRALDLAVGTRGCAAPAEQRAASA